ncbi:unnamed protein product [Closterium sp. NIES-53]
MGASGSKATSVALDSHQSPPTPVPPAPSAADGRVGIAAAPPTTPSAVAAPAAAEAAAAADAAAVAAAAREQRLRAAELEARARVLSSKVRCVECGHQSIEESNADVAVFMRKMIRDELRAGRREGEILEALKGEYGDSVVYSPPFHGASAALWLTPVVAELFSSPSSLPSPPFHLPLIAASTRCLYSQQQPHQLFVADQWQLQQPRQARQHNQLPATPTQCPAEQCDPSSHTDDMSTTPVNSFT